MLQYCTFLIHLYCMKNVNLIKMKSFDLLLNFLWFISSKLINVQQTHVKYINPAWINVEVKVIDIFYYYLLIFLDVLFIIETISHWHARISIKKKDQRKTYWADTWWRWITLDNLNIPQDTYCFGRFYFIKLCQIFTTTITQSNVIT